MLYMADWRSKLDPDVVRALDAESGAIRCQIRVQRGCQSRVQGIVEQSGGVVGGTTDLLPAVAAIIPSDGLVLVASSEFVERVEADTVYRVAGESSS